MAKKKCIHEKADYNLEIEEFPFKIDIYRIHRGQGWLRGQCLDCGEQRDMLCTNAILYTEVEEETE